MPLDDIFHEKPERLTAKKLKVFWRWSTIVLSIMIALIIVTYDVLEDNFFFVETFPAIVVLIYLPILFIAYPFSKVFSYFIVYRNFSKEERADIYYYIIVSLFLFVYFMFFLDQMFFDSKGFDWLFEDF